MTSDTKNFGFRRKAGILMPVSSLPGKYGIGSFGREAYEFVDFLCATSQKCWQVLPLNPTSYGDSPYQSPASVAGNPYFIDLETLFENGLLTKEELGSRATSSDRVDYGALFETRYKTLRLAFSRFAPDKNYKRFVKENASWLESYALFMALKEENCYRPWPLWGDGHNDYKKAFAERERYEGEMSFWRWVQYEFSRQWQALRLYAKERGIMIIGDMPIYVAHDSMDVWSAPEQFLLDESYNPTVVAGVPPDDFSADGQLWGNPIYNWQLMVEQGFSWWLDRVGCAFKLYDILRIDHFRGFAGYYNVKFGEPTAVNGKWDSAPGIELFKAIAEKYPSSKIIAEDLGVITDDVRALLDTTGFPGMKMLHFAFYDEDSEYLPRMFKSDNCVAYTSSHDSDCSLSWIKTLGKEARARFNRECAHKQGQSRVCDLIELALDSRANLAVVPIQDYLELSNEKGRMNVPATPSGNWTWRVSLKYNTARLRSKILSLTVKSGREYN